MNENDNQVANPYAAPTAVEITAKRDEAEVAFIPDGRVVSAGNGATWVGDAWTLFKKNPGIFIAAFIIQIVIGFALNVIPLLGMFLGILVGPIFGAGWIAMAANAHNDEPVEINQFFAGLQKNAGPLFTIGAIYMGLSILFFAVLAVLVVILFGTAILGAFTGGDASGLSSLMAGGSLLLLFLVFLVALVGSFLLYATTWFAPALVMLHNVAPFDAMKQSFSAFLKNWLPFLILLLVYMGLAIASLFTLGLALLVVIPLVLLATYTSYRDVFTDA